MQVAVHGEGAQHRVLLAPRDRLGAQGEVLEGRGGESGEAGVHPCRVGGQDRPLVGVERLHGTAGDEAGPDEPCLPVHLEGGPAEQRGELAGGAAPQEVHLEEAVLRVEKAGRPRHVGAAAPAHDRDAVRVPLDPHRRGEPVEHALALELGEARPQARLQVGTAAAGGQDDGRDGAAQDERPAPSPRARSDGRGHLAFDWLATASAAFFAASGSPR